MNTPPRMPTLYIPHGAGPCFFMDWNPADAWDKTAAYLRSIASSLPTRPQAIVLVTAHWLGAQPCMSSAARPGMLFDYYGFPPHTYELSYPAPGAPALAERARGLLADAGIAAAVDTQRGYDHGTFIPLMVAFPDADVPVLQVSLLGSLDAQAHIGYGQALAPLRDEGVLILGSGSATHNLADFRGGRTLNEPPRGYVKPFDDWLVQTVEAGDEKGLAGYERAPEGRRNHPTPEHFLPIFVPFGAALAAGDGKGRALHRSYTYGVLAMTAFAWGIV